MANKTANTLTIDHSDVPIRLFKSDFLEFFTHITPLAVTIIWVPVILYFFVRGIVDLVPGQSWTHIPAAFLLGIVVWTFTEYLVHRFVFHYEPKNERVAAIWFMFHGVHHVQPQLKTRLVMPPALSIPGAIVFYGLFYLIFAVVLNAGHWVAPFFSGFILGYLAYDLIHYATHHWPMRGGVMKYLKRYHMQHHFKTPEARFGVSSPVWDVVFNTKPSD